MTAGDEELPRGRVEPQLLQDERQRAGRRRVTRELVMVKVVQRGLVPMANVHHGDAGVRQLILRRVAPLNGRGTFANEQTSGEEFVAVCATAVGNDLLKIHVPPARPDNRNEVKPRDYSKPLSYRLAGH